MDEFSDESTPPLWEPEYSSFLVGSENSPLYRYGGLRSELSALEKTGVFRYSDADQRRALYFLIQGLIQSKKHFFFTIGDDENQIYLHVEEDGRRYQIWDDINAHDAMHNAIP